MNTKDPLTKVVIYTALAGAFVYLLQHTQILQTLLGVANVG